MQDENSQSMPSMQPSPLPQKPAIGANMTAGEGWGLVLVLLLIVCFLIPGAGILAVPILIIGGIAGIQVFKDAAKTSPGANIAVKAFKVIVGIGIALVTLFIAGIAFLFYILSSSDSAGS